MMTNFGLMMLSQAIRQRLEAQQKGTKFSYKQAKFATSLVPLHGSICGVDMTDLFVCCSAEKKNASQTINALNFGSTFGELKVKEVKVTPKSREKMIIDAKKIIDENTHALGSTRAGGARNRYTLIRQARLKEAETQLALLSRLQ
eukprot:m.11188 g.11188  ORF g.11188 m.11188 type:complete len:145 (-) comp4396_c0_seq1:77-511(-)